MIRDQKGFTAITVITVFFVILAIGASGFYVYTNNKSQTAKTTSISSFDECVAAGNPVMESFPEQCSADGVTYVNYTSPYTIAHEGLIVTYDKQDWKDITPFDETFQGRKSSGLSLSTNVFQIGFAFGQDGKGGFTCFDLADFNPETCKSESRIAKTIQLKNQSVNIVANMHKEPDTNASYVLYLTDESDCKDAFNCSFPATNEVFKDNSSVTASYSDGRTFSNIDDFLAQPEVKRAVEIFSSLRY